MSFPSDRQDGSFKSTIGATFRDKVVHNYCDRSQEPDPLVADSNGGKAGLDHNFCMKLHYLLENSQDQSHVISWQPHGRCFMVHDMKEFVSSMLPLWFRQSKFASFQRQLNLYGFQRLTQGRDKNAYYHEYFLRGRSLLCQKIVRTKVKGRGARKASSPETEPRLYELPWMPESRPTTSQQAKENASQNSNFIPTNTVAPNPASIIDPTLLTLAERAPASSVPCLTSTASPITGLEAARSAIPYLANSLGDALSFLTYSQALQTAAVGAYNFQNAAAAQGEVMLLPSLTRDDASTNTSSSAFLNSLLASVATNSPQSARATGSLSSYLPMAPPPPTQVLHAAHFKPWEDAKGTGSTATNAYVTLLAALKAQHQCIAAGVPDAVSNQNVRPDKSASTRFGPPPV